MVATSHHPGMPFTMSSSNEQNRHADDIVSDRHERVLVVEWKPGGAAELIPETLERIREAGNTHETYALSGPVQGRELQVESELEEAIAKYQPDAILWLKKPIEPGEERPDPVAPGAAHPMPAEQRSQSYVFLTVAHRTTGTNYEYQRSSTDIQVLNEKSRSRKILVQTNNPILDPVTGFSYDLFRQLAGKKRKPAMVPTLLLTALFFVLGSLVAFFGGVIHSMTTIIPGTTVSVPLGLGIAIILVGLVTNAGRGLLSSKIPLIGVLAGITFTIIIMSLYPIQGTFFIQETMIGFAWIVLGALVPLMIAMWPKIPQYVPEIV